MSYIELPFPFASASPEDLEGLFAFSDKDSKLVAAQNLRSAFAGDDAAARQRSLFGLSGNALQGAAGDAIPASLRTRLIDLLRYQAQRSYQLTFIFNPEVDNTTASTADDTATSIQQTLGLKRSSAQKDKLSEFTLPYAPLLSLRMANKVVAKVVSRRHGPGQTLLTRGSIKERWGISDVEISIAGVLLFHSDNEYPLAETQNLYRLLQEGSVGVKHILLNSMGIHHVVIENVDLPPTKGNNQQYRIKALSDSEDYDLLQESDDEN